VNDAKKEKEEEQLLDLTASKLEAVWNDVKFMKKLLARFSEIDSNKVILWCLFEFAAEKSIEFGQTKEEFLDAAGLAFDDSSEDEEDDISSNEELEEEGLDEETERMNAEAEPEHGDDSQSDHTEEE
jgi:hypothetical protein